MAGSLEHLDRFLRAVRRRWAVVRVAESIGLGLLGGCAVAAVVLPVHVWMGTSPMPFIWTAGGIAVAWGLVHGVARRPDLFAAAREADRQLDLGDLLSSALAVRGRRAADAWAEVVTLSADARCRALNPNAVVVNRYGGRAWGGIGLAAAFVLTVGLMSANPRSSDAVAVMPPPPIGPPSQPQARAIDLIPPRAGATPSASQASPQRRGPAEQRGDEPLGTAGANDPGARHGATAGSDGNGGAGLATSPRQPNAARPSPPVTSGDSPTHDDGANAAGGTGSSRGRWGGDDVDSGGASARQHATTAAPAWTSPAWPAARAEALSAVRDGRVGDAYRDLVRSYFDDSGGTAPAPR